MKQGFYKIEDCVCSTSTTKKVINIIYDKLKTFRENNFNTPRFIFLDKKSYKQLNKQQSEILKKRHLIRVFGLEVKIVKSKEQTICVGI